MGEGQTERRKWDIEGDGDRREGESRSSDVGILGNQEGSKIADEPGHLKRKKL